MFRHLQFTLIGAVILAALCSLAGAVGWVFMQIQGHPYILGTIVAILLSWGIGLFAVANV